MAHLLHISSVKFMCKNLSLSSLALKSAKSDCNVSDHIFSMHREHIVVQAVTEFTLQGKSPQIAKLSHLPPGLPMSIHPLRHAADPVHKHRSLAILHHSSSLGCCWLWRLAANALL